ncbi:MAG: S41 family peptidase [Chloroflexaceae bacterium]|nr:S41 family peptidase [Chloroflexaceae bacterium]
MRFFGQILRFQLPFWFVLPLMTFGVVLGLGGGIVATRLLTPSTSCPESPEVCAEFGVFWQAWSVARDNFVDPAAVDPQRMTDGAIQGMLDSLGDQGHTRYLSADDARRWRESLQGEFEGIGIYIDIREGKPTVVEPIENSPAARAGLRAGDIILQVNGENASDWTVADLSEKVRGPRGSSVSLTLLREGEANPITVSVTRDKIEVPNVTWSMLANQVAMVRLNSFGQDSADEMRAALREAQQQGARALVLDLRNNPGGLLREAVDIASQFLPQGTTVLLEENREGQRTPTTTEGGGVALNIPMVVLINGGSASSAEILSGALQEAGRAKLIGVPTIGTGTVLNTFNLDGGAQVLLGTQQWLTPSGQLIRGQGILPDVRVALPDGVQLLRPADAARLSAEALNQASDTQLVQALETLGGVAGR